MERDMRKLLGSKTKELWQNPEYRQMMSDAHKGNPGYWKGKKLSKETRLKLSIAHKKNPTRYWLGKIGPCIGEENKAWRGDDVGYVSLHKWVQRHMGRATKCMNGHKNKKLYVWANISGEYKRDLTDWQQLCHGCNLQDGVSIHPRFK